MARTAIPVVPLTRSGVQQGSAIVASATGKHYLTLNDGRTILMITSTDAGTQTVSIGIATLVDGQAVVAKVISIPAAVTVLAGPFPIGDYNQVAIAASGTLTSDATNVANNETVTIDTTVYTFKTTLTGAGYEIKIGANAAASLLNLQKAIDLTGSAGTDYGTGTAIHPTVTAGTATATTVPLTAKIAGAAGAAIATTETSAHLSFAAATLVDGFDAGAVLIDPSVSTTLALRAFSVA